VLENLGDNVDMKRTWESFKDSVKILSENQSIAI